MRLLIAGAGGHGRVVADAAEGWPELWSEIAFLDDRYPQLTRSGAWPVVGSFAQLAPQRANFEACVAALGDASLRLAVLEQCQQAGFEVPVIAHRQAMLSRHASVGSGTFIAAGAVVCVGSQIGMGCIINTGATVDHDGHLGAGVHVCPGAHLAGSVKVGARTWFGIGAVAREGVRIGSDVTVGAGAVCLEDVRDGVVVAGVPAREKNS
ncbi:MAG TPA: acetyltransferase [Steroidobacteraceae bacterium]|jgi:sugar O-acyltransferase (sialic acid O-acetyltransferase NeuD family)